MKSKKIVILCLVMTMIMSSFGMYSYAAESNEQYAITEDKVVIDYVEYEIVDNTIFYEGKTYEIIDYTLISYDEEGKILLVLPIEQNRIKDQARIKALNDKVRGIVGDEKSIPSNPVDLPYSDYVPKGQWSVETPVFDNVDGEFYRFLKLRLYDFSPLAEKEFAVGYNYADQFGEWYGPEFDSNYDFGGTGIMKFENVTGMRYGIINLANLYGDPSPSYTYRIYLAAA